ncbi:MAG: type II toxin-antitoxin system HicB family antitoxin [Blautia sp.]|nr:type II toxin-antitoxin system HicB family antitoxin [Blautia sp.]
MKFIYPAVFKKCGESGFEGFFPDLYGINVKADSLEEAVELANEAARNWIEAELAEEEPEMPPVTDIDDLSPGEGGAVRNICVTVRFYEGWDE